MSIYRVFSIKVLLHRILDMLDVSSELPVCLAFLQSARRRRIIIKGDQLLGVRGSLPVSLCYWYATTFPCSQWAHNMFAHCISRSEGEILKVEEILWHESAYERCNVFIQAHTQIHRSGGKPVRGLRPFFHMWRTGRPHPRMSEHNWEGLALGLIELKDIPVSSINVLLPLSCGRLREALPFLERGDGKLVTEINVGDIMAEGLSLLLEYVNPGQIASRWKMGDNPDDNLLAIVVNELGDVSSAVRHYYREYNCGRLLHLMERYGICLGGEDLIMALEGTALWLAEREDEDREIDLDRLLFFLPLLLKGDGLGIGEEIVIAARGADKDMISLCIIRLRVEMDD